MLVQAITSIFMQGFQYNLAQMFIWDLCSGKLKGKVTLEGQTMLDKKCVHRTLMPPPSALSKIAP